MAEIAETNMEYQMFKGLQRPLEFMGLQGRYITWAAITAGVGILGFMLVYALVGFLVALAFAAIAISCGIGLIMVKQRRGLYSKGNDRIRSNGLYHSDDCCKFRLGNIIRYRGTNI